MSEIAVLAGSAAAAIFIVSQLPMLIKAGRTKDLSSYSVINIGLANLGNVIYAVYVLSLPPGPIWAIHAFYVSSTALMLFWWLRYARRSRRVPAGDPAPDSSRRHAVAGATG